MSEGFVVARPMSEPSDHRPWSTILMAAHVLALVVGAVVMVMVLATLLDLRTTEVRRSADGGFEGLGEAFATAAILPTSLVILIALVLAALTARGRTSADRGEPGTLRAVAIAAVCLAVPAFFLAVLPAVLPPVLLVLLLAVAAYGVVAGATLRALREPRPSRGGHAG